MTLPKTENFPDDPDLLPPARRRRARRLLAPLDADERAATLDRMARRTSPSFDFFLFSVVAGLLLSLGLLLDSPVFLLLGAVFAPLMAPAVGLAFGTVIGSYKFFLISLVGLLVGGLLVFLVGVGAGLLAQLGMPLELSQAYANAQINWTNFLVLAAGAIFSAANMARAGRSAAAPSVALAYALYLPLSVAGFGLSSGAPHLWPDGLVLFAVNLAWCALLGALTLAVMGFRPMTLFGYTLGAVLVLLGVILIIGFGAFSAVLGVFGSPVAVPTHTPTLTATITPVPPTATLTSTPLPPTHTLAPSLTPTRTPSPSYTPSPTPLPVYGRVQAASGGGGNLRAEPKFDGALITSLQNGTLLQILPDSVEADGYIWLHVIVVEDGRVGWMLQTVVAVATPQPQW